MVKPWKCRLVDTEVMRPLVHVFPLPPISMGMCWWPFSAAAARKSVKSFFRLKMTRSPGFTRNVGDSLPFSSMKQ